MVVGAAVAVGSASDVVFASAVVVVVVVVVLTVVVVVALRGFAEEDTALTLTRTYVSDCDNHPRNFGSKLFNRELVLSAQVCPSDRPSVALQCR